MEITKYSRNRLLGSLHYWNVDKDFAEPMCNYLVYGFEPGGFFSGWYANNVTAILHSHPANTVQALKDLTKWMVNCMPHESWGSREKVQAWLKKDDACRRKILEESELIYTEEEEIMLTLRNTYTQEPHFW